MKLKNLKIKKYTLLRLNLIKFQTYKCKNKHTFFNSVNQLELKIKQILQLIYLYHYNNKRILFVGFPYIKSNYLLNYSKHIFVPKKVWLNRSFINKFVFDKNSTDLIIIFNPTFKELSVFKELNHIKKPIIILGNSKNNINQLTYSISGSFIKHHIKQFCSFLIYTILKQPKII